MTAGVVGALAEALAQHQFGEWWEVSKPDGKRVSCSCEWVHESDGLFSWEAEKDARAIHREHVASVVAALPNIAIIESQPEPPEPAVLAVVSDYECDELGEDLRFGRTHDGRWKGYVNGGKAYFLWPELVRRYGPLRAAGGQA